MVIKREKKVKVHFDSRLSAALSNYIENQRRSFLCLFVYKSVFRLSISVLVLSRGFFIYLL